MNERDVQMAIYTWRKDIHAFPMMLCNIYFYGWESDVLYITNAGYVWEFEVKVSHSDFLADAIKIDKHLKMSNGAGPARFYYVCPPGIIKPEEVPAHAGLAWVTPHKWARYADDRDVPELLSLEIIKAAPQRKVLPVGEKRWKEIAGKAVDRFWSIREQTIRQLQRANGTKMHRIDAATTNAGKE